MSENVSSLRPDVELDEFFSFMWGDKQGFVYAPLKSTDGEEWETHFFRWPDEQKQLTNHVLNSTIKWECYFGPALYKQPTSPIKENILGSQVFWTEFDGNEPTSGILGDKIPHPTLRVRSSNDGHEHFYWRLDYWENNVEKLEQVNKAIAYKLRADTSAWDATQILRPPGTHNHKRSKVVRILSISQNVYSSEFFSGLEIPKQLVKEEINLDQIPQPLEVIAKYKWDKDDFIFFRKNEIPQGSRSSAMMRLAFTCAEMRMSDEEAFSLLLNADERWKKFQHRRDRDKRLLDLINKARHKYPLDPELATEDLQIFNWVSLKELEVHVDWLIPGILQRQGIMLVTGPPSVGKTQFTMQFLIHLALGKPMLGMGISRPRKVTFVSMEMGSVEIKVFLGIMDEVLNSKERALLAENFTIVPLGHSLLFDLDADKKKIRKMIETVHPEIVAFDSLSKITMSSLDEVNSKAVMDFADHLRTEYDTSIVFIHHNRKGQVGNRRPKTIDDVYGSYWLTATPTTVVTLWASSATGEIEIIFLKVRLAQPPPTLKVVRTANLGFEEITMRGLVEDDEESEHSESELPPEEFRPGIF